MNNICRMEYRGVGSGVGVLMNRGTLSMITETGNAWYVGDCGGRWGEGLLGS